MEADIVKALLKIEYKNPFSGEVRTYFKETLGVDPNQAKIILASHVANLVETGGIWIQYYHEKRLLLIPPSSWVKTTIEVT